MEFSYLLEQHPQTKFLVPWLTLFSLSLHHRNSWDCKLGIQRSSFVKRKDCHLSAEGLYFPLCLWWHPLGFFHEGSKANGKTSHSHKGATLGSDNGTRFTSLIARKYLTDITPNLLMPLAFQLWWERCSKPKNMTLINTEESFLTCESPSPSLAALWRPRARL